MKAAVPELLFSGHARHSLLGAYRWIQCLLTKRKHCPYTRGCGTYKHKFLYAASGWVLLGGLLHFSIDVVAQYVRGKRVPRPETTLFFGLNTSYALGQVLVGLMALQVLRSGNPVLGRWPGLTFGFASAAGRLAVCLVFLEYTQPRGVVMVLAVLLGAAAFTS